MNMASTLQTAIPAARPRSRGAAIAFWSVTGLLCLWMAFTAYAQLMVPAVADAYKELGFPSAAFRMELSVAKFLGIAVLLFPLPARIKEWAYAGFGIVFVSAFIAHTSVGQGPAHWLWSVVAFAFLAVSYMLRRNNLAK
jgi:hypothetical protein